MFPIFSETEMQAQVVEDDAVFLRVLSVRGKASGN
jgi:hypothetical protein